MLNCTVMTFGDGAMREITVNGTTYKSLRAACMALNLNYKKVRERCRVYKRARLNPALAIAWESGAEPFNPKTEPVTDAMRIRRARTAIRMEACRGRSRTCIKSLALDIAYGI